MKHEHGYRMHRFSRTFLTALFACVLLSTSAAALDLSNGTWRHIRRQVPQNAIATIHPLNGGGFLAGTTGSLHTWDGTHWHLREYAELGINAPFFRDPEGRLYFIDNQYLAVLDGEILTRYTDVRIAAPAMGALHPDGMLYIGSFDNTNGGVFTFDGATVTKIRDTRVRTIAADADGRVWITATPPSGVMTLEVLEDGVWADRSAEIASLYPLSVNEITVQIAQDGRVWVMKRNKYAILDGSAWSFHDGGGAPVVAFFDSAGRVWGYGYNKVYLLDGTGMWQLTLTQANGIWPAPWFMTETEDGALWTFDGAKLFKYTGAIWAEQTFPYELESDTVTTLAYTADGDLMCGHGIRELSYEDQPITGVSIRNDGEWLNYTAQGLVPLTDVFQLKPTEDATIIAFTSSGFKESSGGGWSSLDSLQVYSSNDFLFKGATMWIATYMGLIDYEGRRDYTLTLPFDRNEQVRVDNLFDFGNYLYMQIDYGTIVSWDYDKEWLEVAPDVGTVNDFVVTPDETVWAARTGGLCTWDRFNVKWNLQVDLGETHMIEFDDDGRIWASGFDNTGYMENGTWHRVPELAGYAASAMAIAEDGRAAFNLFNADRTQYYGIMEFDPSTGVADGHHAEPAPFAPPRVYPNPFNAYTTIEFILPEAADVRIDIHSLTGQRIATLVQGGFPAGRHSVRWDATTDDGGTAATGMYIVRVRAGNRSAAGKLLYIR